MWGDEWVIVIVRGFIVWRFYFRFELKVVNKILNWVCWMIRYYLLVLLIMELFWCVIIELKIIRKVYVFVEEVEESENMDFNSFVYKNFVFE